MASNATYMLLGAVAQLGERLNGIQEVSGSIPLSSTHKEKSMFKYILLITLTFLQAYPWGPPSGHANNMPNLNNCTACHSGSVNTGDGSIIFTGLPSAYNPGETYSIGVVVGGSNSGGFGFQAIAMAGNQVAGSMVLNSNSNLVELNEGYIQQSMASSTGSWVFDWIAPESDIGDIRFSASGLAAGYPSSTAGDEVYTTSNIISVQQVAIQTEFTPSNYFLYPNYPNPFNPETNLVYHLPKQSNVKLIIYDIFGNTITKLVDEVQTPGIKSVVWNATSQYGHPVSAGTYFFRIEADNYKQSKKMVLLK